MHKVERVKIPGEHLLQSHPFNSLTPSLPAMLRGPPFKWELLTIQLLWQLTGMSPGPGDLVTPVIRSKNVGLPLWVSHIAGGEAAI